MVSLTKQVPLSYSKPKSTQTIHGQISPPFLGLDFFNQINEQQNLVHGFFPGLTAQPTPKSPLPKAKGKLVWEHAPFLFIPSTPDTAGNVQSGDGFSTYPLNTPLSPSCLVLPGACSSCPRLQTELCLNWNVPNNMFKIRATTNDLTYGRWAQMISF